MSESIRFPSPFGHPDGAREDFANLIEFGLERWGALGTNPEDAAARVIVGRKGSGKTYFMRRVHDAMKRAGGYVSDIYEDPPPTDLVVDFSRRYAGNGRIIEKWAQLWRCSILSSVLSHIARNSSLGKIVGDVIKNSLEQEFSELFSSSSRPSDVCAQAQHFLSMRYNRGALDRLLDSNVAHNLRAQIANCIRLLPPLFFFVDGIDDSFDRAPHDWLLCQRGLLDAVRKLLPDTALGGKLHVSIALRDVVWSAAKDSEHAARRADETYVRVLHWSREASEFFLKRKVETLDPRWFKKLDASGRTITGWLGVSNIPNLRYKIQERTTDYLLRHTRMLPRDIVVMGNNLCRALADETLLSSTEIAPRIREVVSECATLFGVEQLRTCASEFASKMIPREIKDPDQFGAYLDNPDLTEDITDEIRKLLRCTIGVTRFPKAILEKGNHAWSDLARERYAFESADLSETLWRNQLLGCRTVQAGEARDMFFDDRSIGKKLPDADEYLLHPILTDAANVSANGERPVVPWSSI
jgi:hypothetical protein